MNRLDLEHLIRSASNVTKAYELIIIGSQSILGKFPSAPSTLRLSGEADMFVEGNEAASDAIDANIGELSQFHATHGYYAQGVGVDTALLPDGWKNRLIAIQNENTDLRIGRCLHPLDLAAAKLAAGREKDWSFVSEMLFHGLTSAEELSEALSKISQDRLRPERLQYLTSWVKAQGPLHQRSRDAANRRFASLHALQEHDNVAEAMVSELSTHHMPADITTFASADSVHEKVVTTLASRGTDPKVAAERLTEMSPWAVRPLEVEILLAIAHTTARTLRPR